MIRKSASNWDAAVDLNDPIWTPVHIGHFLHLGRTSVYRLIKQETFPRSRDPLNGKDLRWFSEEVQAWFSNLNSTKSEPASIQRRIQPVVRRRSAAVAA